MALRIMPAAVAGDEDIAAAADAEGVAVDVAEDLIGRYPEEVHRGMTEFAGKAGDERDWREAWAPELAGYSDEEVRVVMRTFAAKAGSTVYDEGGR